MAVYYCILTQLGLNKISAAKAAGDSVVFTHLAVGDSNGNYYEPVPGQVSLVREVWRGEINRIYVHPNNANWAVIECILPSGAGPFDIREVGVFDGSGDLLAVGKYPLTSKPAPGSGSEKDLYVRMVLQVSNAVEVFQQIDPSLIFATKEYVDTRDWRESVRAATTAPIADLAAGAPATLDGVALATGDRILVKNQANAVENGIYTVQTVGTGANGEWGRSIDADSSLDFSANLQVSVEQGSANSDSLWMLISDPPITLGTTALVFKRVVTQSELDAHANRVDNPHGVTAAQVGAEPAGSVAAHANRTDNPHGVTAIQVGAEPAGSVAAHVAAAAPHSGHETPAGAQAKVDVHDAKVSPHSSHLLDSTLASGTDLNTVTRSGAYRLQGVHPNLFPGGGYSQLFVVHGSGDTITQIGCPYGSAKLYIRCGNPPDVGGAGTWSSWVELETVAGAQAKVDGHSAAAAPHSGHVPTSRTFSAGNGLSGGGDLSANRSIALGTPSTLTENTGNGTTSTSHSHALSFTQSKAVNGYIKLPGGLILQWGEGTTSPLYFPITFPNAVLQCVGDATRPGYSSGDHPFINAIYTNRLEWVGVTFTKRYLAIGY